MKNLTDDDLFVSGRSGKFVVGFEGNFFNTDGFPIIAKSQRGPIDSNASSRHEVFNGRVGYQLNDTDTVFLHGQFFDEDHNDGTMTDTPDVGAATSTTFPDRTHVAFNPKLSVLYRATDWFSLRGAVYRAFRAPNLAELYRQSSVEACKCCPTRT